MPIPRVGGIGGLHLAHPDSLVPHDSPDGTNVQLEADAAAMASPRGDEEPIAIQHHHHHSEHKQGCNPAAPSLGSVKPNTMSFVSDWEFKVAQSYIFDACKGRPPHVRIQHHDRYFFGSWGTPLSMYNFLHHRYWRWFMSFVITLQLLLGFFEHNVEYHTACTTIEVIILVISLFDVSVRLYCHDSHPSKGLHAVYHEALAKSAEIPQNKQQQIMSNPSSYPAHPGSSSNILGDNNVTQNQYASQDMPVLQRVGSHLSASMSFSGNNNVTNQFSPKKNIPLKGNPTSSYNQNSFVPSNNSVQQSSRHQYPQDSHYNNNSNNNNNNNNNNTNTAQFYNPALSTTGSAYYEKNQQTSSGPEPLSFAQFSQNYNYYSTLIQSHPEYYKHTAEMTNQQHIAYKQLPSINRPQKSRNWIKQKLPQLTWSRVRVLLLLCTFLDIIITEIFNLHFAKFYRLTRLIRPYFFLEKGRVLRQLVTAVVRVIPSILEVVVLIALTISTFSLAGFFLYSKKGLNIGSNEFFSTIENSMFSMTVLMTTANFPDVMMSSYTAFNPVAIFFVAFLIIALYLLFNVILSAVYARFQLEAYRLLHTIPLTQLYALTSAFELLSRPAAVVTIPQQMLPDDLVDYEFDNQHYYHGDHNNIYKDNNENNNDDDDNDNNDDDDELETQSNASDDNVLNTKKRRMDRKRRQQKQQQQEQQQQQKQQLENNQNKTLSKNSPVEPDSDTSHSSTELHIQKNMPTNETIPYTSYHQSSAPIPLAPISQSISMIGAQIANLPAATKREKLLEGHNTTHTRRIVEQQYFQQHPDLSQNSGDVMPFTAYKKQSWLYLLNLGYTQHHQMTIWDQYTTYLQLHYPNDYKKILARQQQQQAKDLGMPSHYATPGPFDCSQQDVISQETFLQLLKIMRPDLTLQQQILLFEALDQQHHHHIHINDWFSVADLIDVRFIDNDFKTRKQQLQIAPHNIPTSYPSLFKIIGEILCSNWFNVVMDIVCLTHFFSLLMQLEQHEKQGGWYIVMDYLNAILLCVYATEYLLKIVIFGPRRVWNSLLYVFELILIILTCATYITLYFDLNNSWSDWAVTLTTADLLAFRAIRIYRHLYKLPRFRAILLTIRRLYPALRSLFVILISEYYFFGTLGVCLYKDVIQKGKMSPEFMATYWAQNNYWENHFNDLYHAYITLFEIMIINNWNLNIEGWTVALNSHWPRIYFVCHFFLAIIIILNCVIALVLDAFIGKYSTQEAKEEEKELKRQQRQKQKQMEKENTMLLQTNTGSLFNGEQAGFDNDIEALSSSKAPTTLKEMQRKQRQKERHEQQQRLSSNNGTTGSLIESRASIRGVGSSSISSRRGGNNNGLNDPLLLDDDSASLYQSDHDYVMLDDADAQRAFGVSDDDTDASSDDDEGQQLVLTLIKRADHEGLTDSMTGSINGGLNTSTPSALRAEQAQNQQRIVFKRRTQRMYQMIFDK